MCMIRQLASVATLITVALTSAKAIGQELRMPPAPLLSTHTVAVAPSCESIALATEEEIQSVLEARATGGAQQFGTLPHVALPAASDIETEPELTPVATFTSGKVSRQASPRESKPSMAPELPVNNQKFYSADKVYGKPDINTYTITFSVTGTTDKTYKVKGVYGQSSATLVVTFNDDGSAEIAAQKYITNNSTYGNIWFCPVDLSTNTYSLTDPVTCSRDEEGNWTMGAWGLVVNHTTDKGYNGSVLFVSEDTRWLVPNMTATFQTTDASGNVKDNTFEGAWFQENPSSLYLLNMGSTTFGRAINVSLAPQGTGIVSPQFVSSAGGYGNLYAYHADYSTGYADSSKSANCRVEDNSLVFDDLIIATRKISTSGDIRIAASPITYTLSGAAIQLPEQISIDFQGAGTAADPYLIKSPDDILAMSAAIPLPGYATAFYRLDNDIDLSTLTGFSPVGNETVPFNGTFDGNQKKLSGLTYNGFGLPYTGLFGVIGNRGVVKNLTLENFTVYATGANAGIITGFNAGGDISGVKITSSLLQTQAEVAGAIAGMNTGVISSCRINTTIEGYGSNGGVTGYNCGEIGDCHYSGNMAMSGALSTSYRHIAGIAGQSLSSESNGFRSHIHDCTVSGTISDDTGYAYVGGITAVSHGSKTEDPAVIERCVNTATLSATGLDWASDATLPKSYCGGIAAYISSSKIEDCANGGLILETTRPKVFTGGIAGIAAVSFISSGSDQRLGQVSSVSRCLSAGQIYSVAGAGCGIFGAVPVLPPFDSKEVASQIFTDCYADNQINLLTDDDFAISTADLTSGQLPGGFSPTVWTAASERYPVPASLKEIDAAILFAAPACLAAGENYTNVKKDFKVDGASSVKWAILGNNGSLTQSTPSLSISGSNATIGSQYGNNWLVASNGDIVKMMMVCVVPKLFEGDGTQETPFLISSIADMATLNSAVATYGQSHLGDWFRMTADIDASEDPSFVCVGYPAMTRPFNGTFDGDGHAFHNLTVKTAFRTASGGVTANKSYQYGGLFSYVGPNGTIRNVVIADDCEYDLYNMSGSIAGLNYGAIEDCRNYAAIGANGMATGGIVGENNGSVTGCYNAGTVTIQQNAIKTGSGGIAGANTGLVDLCQNDGNITIADGKTSEVSGGITAINYGKIDRSLNLGEVKANMKAGGITATLGAYGQPGEISRSANFATVTTVKDNSNGAVTNDIREYKVSDVVYDCSLTAIGASINPLPGCTALSTLELVSGEAPAGLPSEVLDLKAGKYPVLKNFASEPRAELLRSTYIGFNADQSVANLSSDASLAAPAGVAWSVTGSDSFSIDGQTIKVTTPEGDISAKAQVMASAGDSPVKTFAVTSLPILFEGDGSAEAPYLIKSKDDLNTLSGFISKNAYDCLNLHYLLANDIAYEDGDEFSPIGGDGTTRFNGTFDGNGKTVSGITYTCTTAKPGKNTGLFGQLGPQGMIHDLTVDNSFTGYGAGGVAAQVEGEIHNCVNKGAITATGDPAGGIAGTLKSGGIIRDCLNTGTVMSEKTYGTGGIAGKTEKGSSVSGCVNKGSLGGEAQGKALGGIAGLAGGSFTDCRNEGQLTSETASVGGIVGKHASGSLLEISGCSNLKGIILPKAIAVGGIIGGNDSDKSLNQAKVHITSCDNEGNIVGVLGVGGIAGIVSESDFTMTDCDNTAAIEALNLGAKGAADTFAGGIAGCANGSVVDGTDCHIKDCRNTGIVTAYGGNNIGGIVGKNGVPVIGCRNTGEVKAIFGGEDGVDYSGFSLSSIGGISGSSYGGVRDSWNAAPVTTDGSWVGGIAGYTNKDIIGCVNIGAITGQAGIIPGGSDPQGVGGIVGRMGSVSYAGFITDTYNTGAVTGLTQVAGIVAQRFGNEAQLQNVYNTGSVTATADGGTAFPIGNQRTQGAQAIGSDANVYYLEGCCPPSSALDNGAKEMTREELSTAELGASYLHSPGALPVLANLPSPAKTYLDAIFGLTLEYEDDSYDSVKGNIFYASLEGLDWTSSDNLHLTDGIATPTADGAAWMRVAINGEDDSHFKQFELDIKAFSDLDEIPYDKDVISREYFDLRGIHVTSPAAGSVYIEMSTLSDGTVRARRVCR